MTLWQKRAWLLTAIWLPATIGFLVISLGGDGPAALGKDTPKRDLAGVFVFAGIAADLVVRGITRKRKDRADVDERDESIHRRSSEIALWVTVAGVFLGCVALNDAFGTAGAVPADWLWFVAWATMAASHVGQAVAAAVLYSLESDRGEG